MAVVTAHAALHSLGAREKMFYYGKLVTGRLRGRPEGIAAD
jgi:hypothetical protein